MTLMQELKDDVKSAISAYEKSWQCKWFGISDRRKADISLIHKKLKNKYPHGVALKNAIEDVFERDAFQTGLLRRSRLRNRIQHVLNMPEYADKVFWKLHAERLVKYAQSSAVELKRIKQKDAGQCQLIVELQTSVDDLENKLAKARVEAKQAKQVAKSALSRSPRHVLPPSDPYGLSSQPVHKPQVLVSPLAMSALPFSPTEDGVTVLHKQSQMKRSWSLLSIFSSKSKSSTLSQKTNVPDSRFTNPRRASFELSLKRDSDSDDDVSVATPLLKQYQ